eukprot:217903-Rhodomonas_salina.1
MTTHDPSRTKGPMDDDSRPFSYQRVRFDAMPAYGLQYGAIPTYGMTVRVSGRHRCGGCTRGCTLLYATTV